MPSLQAVAVAKFPYIENMLDDINSPDREWRQHVVENGLSDDMEWADYWKLVNEARHPDGSKKYPNFMKFVGVVAALPSSNAGVERIFSSLRLIKTERRGSMKVATLVGLMQTRFKIKSSSSFIFISFSF